MNHFERILRDDVRLLRLWAARNIPRDEGKRRIWEAKDWGASEDLKISETIAYFLRDVPESNFEINNNKNKTRVC